MLKARRLKRGAKTLAVYVISLCMTFVSSLPLVAEAHSYRSSREKIHPKFTHLEVGGRSYQYFEAKNKNGKVIRQFLLGKDRTELMIDENGDGFLENWEIATPDGKLSFSWPFKGKFQMMELESATAKGLVKARFAWNPKINQYSLFEMKGHPYKTWSYDDEFIVGCLNNSNEQSLRDLSIQLNQALDKGNMQSELAQTLKKEAMDEGCKKEPFSKVSDSIIAGMMKVATNDMRDLSQDKVKPDQKGQYLQCMRFFNLGTHASRIEAAFAQYTSLVAKDSRYAWKLQCSPTDGKDLAGYKEPNGTYPIIKLHADDAKIREHMRALGIKNPTPADYEQAYAKLFFHEMLHYSNMAEKDAHTVTSCCAPDNLSHKSKACEDLKKLTETQSTKQGLENYIIGRLPGGYAELRNALRLAYGDDGDADRDFEHVIREIANAFNEYKKDPRCEATDSNPLGKCVEDFKYSVKEYVKEMYGGQDGSECRRVLDRTIGKEEAVKSCSTVEAMLNSIADQGNPSAALQKLCPNIKVQSKRSDKSAANQPFLRMIALALKTNRAIADADDDVHDQLCAAAGTMSNGSVVWNPNPTEGVDQKFIQPGVSRDDVNQVGGSDSISPSPNNSKTVYEPVTGPSRPLFANDSTTRTKEIVNHITKSDNFITQFKTIAQKGFDTIIPRAQAEPSRFVKQGGSTTSDSSRKSPDDSGDYSISKVPKINVPDPLGSFGANGAGGVPIAARAPASLSQPPVRTARENDAKSSAGLPAQGPASQKAANANVVGNTQAEKQNADPRKKEKRILSPSEERALQALLNFLQRDDYSRVKQEIQRPSVESSMIDHGVQVVDDDGQQYGAGYPDYKLIYNIKAKKLLLEGTLKPRMPASKKRR